MECPSDSQIKWNVPPSQIKWDVTLIVLINLECPYDGLIKWDVPLIIK